MKQVTSDHPGVVDDDNDADDDDDNVNDDNDADDDDDYNYVDDKDATCSDICFSLPKLDRCCHHSSRQRICSAFCRRRRC